MKINWLDELPLTYEEAMEFLSHSHEKRLEMEEKNKWDAYVNDFSFGTFLQDTYYYMAQEANKNLSWALHDYEYYPKVKDLLDLEDFWVKENKVQMKKVIKDREPGTLIWEIVEEWWKNIFKVLY